MDANGYQGEHKFTLENYEIVKQTGRRTSASDFVVLHKTELKKYAMKKICLAKHTEKLKQTAYQEMKLLSKLKNPYIVEHEDSWIDKDDNACIFTAYCERGNMADAIRKARGKLFPEEKIFKWLAQLLLALDYLHSNRVLHMDLTCSNVFLPNDDHIQLGNYGLAKLLNPDKPVPMVSGISNSMCPEVLENNPYGYKSDIWSLGCCMYEITAHQSPFKAQDLTGLVNKINRSLLSPLPIVYSSTLKQMIKLMLRKKPEHRPTASELLRNPCLQPYLLQCQNLSPIYLPVFPIKSVSSPKDKPRRNSLPGKFSKEADLRAKETDVSRSLENLYPFWASAETSSSETLAFITSVDDKLETKRIDPSFDTVDISEFTSQHKLEESLADCESVIYTTGKQAEEEEEAEGVHPKETEQMFSEESQLTDVDVGVCSPRPIKEAETQRTVPEPVEHTKLSISGAAETTCDDGKSIEVAARDCLSGSVVIDEAKTEKLTVSEMSSVLSKLTKLGGPPSKERADALECLLETCAGLVKQEKYDELAGLLTPFGEDGVSARDTAIWFAKTLLSADKHNHGK